MVLVAVLLSCSVNISKEEYTQILQKGKELSNQAQATLLANVGQAIQKGGPQYAVEFCNLKASSIIDSLNQANNCSISRVSDKNRNPQNLLSSKTDKELWSVFENSNQMDTLIKVQKKLVYYKRINIAMPACLKCHGKPGTDINLATGSKIKDLYPKDLATGYQLNDFRGLWKIEFQQN